MLLQSPLEWLAKRSSTSVPRPRKHARKPHGSLPATRCVLALQHGQRGGPVELHRRRGGGPQGPPGGRAAALQGGGGEPRGGAAGGAPRPAGVLRREGCVPGPACSAQQCTVLRPACVANFSLSSRPNPAAHRTRCARDSPRVRPQVSKRALEQLLRAGTAYSDPGAAGVAAARRQSALLGALAGPPVGGAPAAHPGSAGARASVLAAGRGPMLAAATLASVVAAERRMVRGQGWGKGLEAWGVGLGAWGVTLRADAHLAARRPPPHRNANPPNPPSRRALRSRT